MTRNTLFILFLLLVITTSGWSQVDSVIVRGKISNLNGRSYREAPFITFSRNNLFRDQSELSKNASLQADGTYRISLPLTYPLEEMYLDWGGKIYTSFLASKGEVVINFNADSLLNTKRPFQFAGQNALANTFYPDYLDEEKTLLNGNRVLGDDFFRTFWNQSFAISKQAIQQRANLKLSALAVLASKGKQANELTQWIQSTVEDEQMTLLLEFALNTQNELSLSDLHGDNWLTTSPLTYQKVIRAARYSDYAQQLIQRKQNVLEKDSKSLPVTVIASLVKDYVRPLNKLDEDKLNLIIEKRNVDRAEMDFLSNLYRNGGDDLATIANFERSILPLKSAFSGIALEYLVAERLIKESALLPLSEYEVLHKHLDKQLFNTYLKGASKEILALQLIKKPLLEQVQQVPLKSTPTEVAPDIFLAESKENGRTWLDAIQKDLLGKTIVLFNWDLQNERSRGDVNLLANLPQAHTTTATTVYLHIPDPDRIQGTDDEASKEERMLWKQYIVQNNLVGIHLFLNTVQAMQLSLRNSGYPSEYSVIAPNGRYLTRNAYFNSNTAALLKTLENIKK